MSLLGTAARVAIVLAAATATASAQGRKTCRNYNCDGLYRCSWKVTKTDAPPLTSLDDSLRVGRSMAQYRGFCNAMQPPFALDGYAISPGTRITFTQTSDGAAQTKWDVKHVNFCPACKFTEGRGRAEAVVSFKARAKMHDPFGSDARAEAWGTLGARESTTGCKAEAKGGVVVASSGAFSVGGGGGPMGPSGSIGWTQNLGNLSEVEQLFHHEDDTPDVEKNEYHVTMSATVDRAVVAANGWMLGFAQAAMELEPVAFDLTLFLSCDYCDHADSKAVEHFPQ
ncbi:MAG: hypothetical protein JNL90_12330 [Planctomycetes bacterium]|nr:hypothetical protein [Planctomycetota bacterium]